jgi:RHS repeat-associated protein
VLTDDAGDVTDTYFTTRGATQLAVTGTTVNPFRWVGQVGYYWDEGTGTFYIRARVYEPVTGRWMSQDPLRQSLLATKLYEYVKNAPFRRMDPTGLEPVLSYPPFFQPTFKLPIACDPDFSEEFGRVTLLNGVRTITIPQHLKEGAQEAVWSIIIHETVGEFVRNTTGEPDSTLLGGGFEYATQAFSNLAQLALAGRAGWGCNTQTQEHLPHLGGIGKREYRAARRFFDQCCAKDSSVQGRTMYIVLQRCTGWPRRSCVHGFYRICCNCNYSVDGDMVLNTWSGFVNPLRGRPVPPAWVTCWFTKALPTVAGTESKNGVRFILNLVVFGTSWKRSHCEAGLAGSPTP